MTNHMNRDSHEMSHKAEALYRTLCTYSVHHFKPFWAFHFTHPSAPPLTSQPISHSLSPPLTMLRCFWICRLMGDTCKTKRRKKGCVWVKIWQKREVVGVTISHSNSHQSTLLQQTQLNYALTHAYLLPDVLTHIHVPFPKMQFTASASPSSAAQLPIPSYTLPDWRNVRHRRTQGTVPPTVHIAHQSSMHRHLSTIHTPPQL